MFVRKKRNKSGSVSVQIVDKSNGRYRVVETIGSSQDQEKVDFLIRKAQHVIRTCGGRQSELFSFRTPEETAVRCFLGGLSNEQIRVIGPELVFGTLFDRLGFGAIPEPLFRHMVIARLAHPVSKVKTVDYLYRYQGIAVEISGIYRFLDKLNDTYKDAVERLAFEYSKSVLGRILVVFYDMTTLYFEAEDEDDLRKVGFSKDGKFQHPQIMLGLLVGEKGYPIGYDIFEGNVFEGHTLLPTLKKIRRKYGLGRPVVVADAALLSRENLKALVAEGYSFIVGARIKNESDAIKEKILEQAKRIKDQEGFALAKADSGRLIVTYSERRRKKDSYGRERGLARLRKKIKSGMLTKEHINNRGYNKFLTLKGSVEISIDETKVKQDYLWDGLKGYMTNTDLPVAEVVENYRQLWQIEKAFRISKTDLRIRPVYHYRRKRIEAHICIAFVAYTIYKELERLLEQNRAGFSPRRAAELTHTMYGLDHRPADGSRAERIILKMDPEQQSLYNITQKG
ncbi:MAG: transposase [Omnitrophica bacterium RIFCSPLOWO2_12_FULL_50_11]|nr:MAG: transposase [Omnitrophica bacterium RIFCSPLOWO2_12_FULL_50_11]